MSKKNTPINYFFFLLLIAITIILMGSLIWNLSNENEPIALNIIKYLLISHMVIFLIITLYSYRRVIKEILKPELHQAKEKAEESETLLLNIFENIPNMIFVKDADDLRFVSFNKAGENILGYKEEELIGKNDYDFFPKDQADFFTSKDRTVFENQELLVIEEERIDTKFGPKVLYTKKIAIRDNQGTPKYLLGISEDVTEKKKTENELREAKERAEEGDRLKSAFLANMSHEIRTPMNGILGFAELLKETGLNEDQQQEYISVIEKSGTRMLNIINDIIDISKIESEQMTVSISDVNINEQLQDLYNFFMPEAKKKLIELKLTKALPDNQSIVETDNDKFFAILTNLIKNAIKYTKSGSIEFGYKLINSKTELEFYVKDTGVGIPEEKQLVIFERFIQADIEDRMIQQGAGLGLAISKAYSEMLDGKIWVDSEPGKGTTFFFTLPYKKKKPAMHTLLNGNKTTISEEREIVNLKILIAEDDQTSNKLLSYAMQRYADKVISVETGAAAIEVYRKNPDIDLIMMDVQMPGMNGYEATRRIRKINNEVVIIAQTAFAQKVDGVKAIAAGCNDHISKPISKNDLSILMQKYFKNRN